MMLDGPLRRRRYEDGADTTAGQDQRERKASALVKPGEHCARIGKLRSPIRNQPQHKEGEIELRDIGSESAERCERKSKDQDRREDDASRRKAIEQHPDSR